MIGVSSAIENESEVQRPSRRCVTTMPVEENAASMRSMLQPAFSVKELVPLLGAVLLAGRQEEWLSALSTDTRALQAGDYFLALKGPRFDGHEFVAEALHRGAAGAIVELGAGRRWLAHHPTTKPVLGVADPLGALQALAIAHRNRFVLPVIGVTGSNGKTTTKEMTAAILSRRYSVHKSQGNFNNQIGLPLTLLGLTAGHAAAVYELGISHRGELTRLCELARPTIGIITNIGPAHVEFLGDLDGVRAAKAELLDGLPVDGVALLNRDDDSYEWLHRRCRGRSVSFGMSSSAEVWGAVMAMEAGEPPRQRIRLQWTGGRVELSLPVVGVHNVSNAAAAVAAALQVGVEPEEIIAGLEQVQLPAMRSEFRRLPGGVGLLLDAYNANPLSGQRALETARQLAGGGRVIAVLGDMLELGPEARRWHEELGRRAAAVGVHRLVTVGPQAQGIADGAIAGGLAAGAVHRCGDVDAAHALLQDWFRRGELQPGDLVLIKGSRAMRMERLLDGIEKNHAGGQAGAGDH